MKNLIIGGIIVFAVGVLAPQILQAQGTIYLSNLGQPSAGSLAVGSDSWLAAGIYTGNNADGYSLNSIQLAMTDASGDPSGFTVMVYANGNDFGFSPGSTLGTLNGSTNPATAGIYTYTPAANLTLLPRTAYYIVLTAGTAVANGAYGWSYGGYAGVNTYNQIGGWVSLGDAYGPGTVDTSTDGLSWGENLDGFNPQYAIDATPVPEPSVLALLVGGAAAFFDRRRHKQAEKLSLI